MRVYGLRFCRVRGFYPPLERRTLQLIRCLEGRTRLNGAVDLVECLAHWSYDFMVWVLYDILPVTTDFISGGDGLRRLQRLGMT